MPKINTKIIQQSEEWFAAKIGKPSASGASRLITSKGDPSKSMAGYAEDLAYELYTGESANAWNGNSAGDYGNEYEPIARADYEFTTSSTVMQVAFIEDDSQRYLISPDGLIGDDGLVEIKCKPKLHLKTLIYYKRHGRIPTDYVAQLQMQLLISQREWVDIYYFHPKLPCLLERVYPDENLIKGLQNQLAMVIVERDKILKTIKEF